MLCILCCQADNQNKAGRLFEIGASQQGACRPGHKYLGVDSVTSRVTLRHKRVESVKPELLTLSPDCLRMAVSLHNGPPEEPHCQTK